jgi:secreted trypsin-like serine protease
MLCVAAGVLLGFSSAAFASSGSAGEAPHARLVRRSLQVASSRLSGRLRVSVRHGSRVSAQVVGGVSAVQGQLGFMAFVEHFDALGNLDFTCSGTVISGNVVLTAGHCAVDENTGAALDPGGYQVVTGAADWTDTTNGHTSGVSRVVVDPAYDPATMTSDAALLVLSTPTTAPAIRLGGSADRNLEQAGTGAVIAGWGDTYAGDPYLTSVLQQASTVVQSSGYCGQFSITYNPAVELCAVDPPYYDDAVCNGDSGGPLLASDASGQPVEIGVTSTGPTDCNTVTADYFTTVRPLSGWATSWINAAAPAPPPPPAPAPTAPPVTTPPPSAPSTPQLPRMTTSTGRSYARQTVAGVFPRAFHHRYSYQTSCMRRSSVRIGCDVWFSSGPNDYWGTVTVHYLFGSNNSLEWTDTYTIHWVNDQCYFHSGHPSSCGIRTKRGSW